MTELRDPAAAEGEHQADVALPLGIPTAKRRLWKLAGLRWALGLVWIGAIALFLDREGVPVDRETIISFTVAGLLIWSIGRRPLLSVIVDWLPFVLVLIVYDYTRGAADLLGSPTRWIWQIDSDRFLGSGHVPTVYLQEHLKQASAPLWEVGISLIYISFYFVPYLVAGWLWLRSRLDFRAFATRFTLLSFLGLAGFILMPAAPPWAAALCTRADVVGNPANPACMNLSDARNVPGGGLLGPLTSHLAGAHGYVERISSRGFASLHLPNAEELLNKGQASVNLVAAIPSLHAATTLMLTLFLWRRVRWGWRIALVLYPLAMAFALIYSAEHYLTDILIGWALAVVVEVGLRLAARYRGRRRQAALTAAPAAQPVSFRG